MDDVATEARVSRATVSRVLAGNVKVNDATKGRVHRAIDRLGYVPNLAAQALATKRSTLVGLLLRDPRKPVYGLLHSEIQDRAAAAGLELITVVPTSSQGAADEQRSLHKLLGLRVAGLLVATGVSNGGHLAPLLGTVPVVSVGRPERHPGIHGISHDERANGRLIADAVADRGHREVAVLAPIKALSSPEHQRAASMIRQLRARDVTVRSVRANTLGVRDEGNAELLELVSQRSVTCVMFPSDERALEFMAACQRAGIAIPEDVSVTGVDGVSAGLGLIGLTTVRLPVADVAARAVSLMADLVAGRSRPVRHQKHAGELVDGTTLGTAGAGRRT